MGRDLLLGGGGSRSLPVNDGRALQGNEKLNLPEGVRGEIPPCGQDRGREGGRKKLVSTKM